VLKSVTFVPSQQTYSQTAKTALFVGPKCHAVWCYSDFGGEINPLDTKNFMPKRESFGSETNKNRGMDLVRTVTRTECNTSYTKITKTNGATILEE